MTEIDLCDFDAFTAIESIYCMPRESLVRWMKDRVSPFLAQGSVGVVTTPVIGRNRFREYFTAAGFTSLMNELDIAVISEHPFSLYFDPERRACPRLVTAFDRRVMTIPQWLVARAPRTWVYQSAFVLGAP